LRKGLASISVYDTHTKKFLRNVDTVVALHEDGSLEKPFDEGSSGHRTSSPISKYIFRINILRLLISVVRAMWEDEPHRNSPHPTWAITRKYSCQCHYQKKKMAVKAARIMGYTVMSFNLSDS
jgi:hypothetical protein